MSSAAPARLRNGPIFFRVPPTVDIEGPIALIEAPAALNVETTLAEEGIAAFRLEPAAIMEVEIFLNETARVSSAEASAFNAAVLVFKEAVRFVNEDPIFSPSEATDTGIAAVSTFSVGSAAG
ncbi:MAG: hypothetical protein U5R30_17050 [Deltaproteobacteria bacterium]|nr:hypothetical protein [Deltaproteobacteria bacterium]